ncbi:MAG: hypothetical protein JXJ04_05115 [Spirochaetales bacterium]|nr:hypothetical protein [Spirochaetales bacterium]
MKLEYITVCFTGLLIFFMVSCDLIGINRNWTGSCVTTYINDTIQVQYSGIVESFNFNEGDSCVLIIRDTFLSDSLTRKKFVGTYNYNERYHSLAYSLILVEIDSIDVNSNMNYDLEGSNTFDMTNETGVLTATISGQDIPIDASIDVVFSLTAE